MPDATLNQLVQALGVEIVSPDTTGDADMAGEGNGTKLVSRSAPKAGGSAFKAVQNQVEHIVREGYSAVQIFSQVSGRSCLQPVVTSDMPGTAARRPDSGSPAAFPSKSCHWNRPGRRRQKPE